MKEIFLYVFQYFTGIYWFLSLFASKLGNICKYWELTSNSSRCHLDDVTCVLKLVETQDTITIPIYRLSERVAQSTRLTRGGPTFKSWKHKINTQILIWFTRVTHCPNKLDFEHLILTRTRNTSKLNLNMNTLSNMLYLHHANSWLNFQI